MITRRELLTQAAVLSGALAASNTDALGATRKNEAGRAKTHRNFVLVHGGFHGGWCYRRVADLLRAQGHYVETPTLTGLGERSHLAGFPINCSTHVEDVINVIRWERLDDVILCGHSYGGIIIGGVADAIPQKISAVVYLDCVLPENGKSAFDLYPSLQAPFVASTADYGGRLVKPMPAKAFHVNAADRDMVDSLLTPQSLASFCEPLILTGAYKRIARKVYISAKDSDHPAPDYIRTDPEWQAVEIQSGHDIMIDAPDALAGVLLSLT